VAHQLDSFAARPRWAVAAIAFGVLCAFATISAVREQTAFSEYLSQARRCVELDDCPTVGGRTGGLPLFHGHSWIRLLSHSLRAGEDLTRVQHIVLALLLLSMPVAFYWLYRYLGLRAAALGLGLYFPVIVSTTDITMLTYTNLLPLPFAVYYLGVALFVETARTRFGALASVGLAGGVSAEFGSIVMVPFHIALAAVVSPRPAFAAIVCGLSFAVPYCLDSMDAALAIVREVPTLRFAGALVICGALVPFLVRLRTRLQPTESAPALERVRLVMAAALVYATATIWIGNLFLLDNVPAPRYFAPASFPFLFVIAERMGRLSARTAIALATLEAVALAVMPWAPYGMEIAQLPVEAVLTFYVLVIVVAWMRSRDLRLRPTPALWPAAVICLSVMAMAAADLAIVARRGGKQTLSMIDAEQVVGRLYSAGYSYPELLGSLQGPAADDLMALLTERDPKRFTEAPPRFFTPDFSLLVIKVPPDMVAATRGVVFAAPASDGCAAVVVRGVRYLDWTRMRRCGRIHQEGTPTGYNCMQPRTDRPLPHNWPYVEFGDPLPPEAVGDTSGVRYLVPVRTPGSGVAHIVRLPDQWPSTWRIVRVTGVQYAGALPGAEIRLPDNREESGVIEFEFAGALPRDLPWVWLPHVIEVAQQNEHLLAPFRRGG
jgi:hypothetical protein